jgi:hypothetical protein
VVFFFIPLFPALIITQGATMKDVGVFPLKIGEPFKLRYIHSIELTPVMEAYKIKPDFHLQLDSVEYSSFGVGLPEQITGDEKLELRDGKIIITNMNRDLPCFDQEIGQVIANHTLLIKGKAIPLAELSPPGSWVRFHARRVCLWTLIRAFFGQSSKGVM